ncbi:hypothetical protein B0H63DRAFT_488595 [Podospora didyma]|uniref:Mid2 domain-containing protein n=1 Tax=Podospora didyma TaxID=330526 RepID=A0AAE0N387_9PEZI|nr:hypothetical protein B0H63DRAFT_488595 [Podospora didyma]
MRPLLFALAAGFLPHALAVMEFVNPPPYKTSTSDNPTYTEGAVVKVAWTYPDAGKSSTLSIQQIDRSTLQTIGLPERITRGILGGASLSWTVSVSFDLKVSNMFLFNVWVEGNSLPDANSRYFNIATKPVVVAPSPDPVPVVPVVPAPVTTSAPQPAAPATVNRPATTEAPLPAPSPDPSPSPLVPPTTSSVPVPVPVPAAASLVAASPSSAYSSTSSSTTTATSSSSSSSSEKNPSTDRNSSAGTGTGTGSSSGTDTETGTGVGTGTGTGTGTGKTDTDNNNNASNTNANANANANPSQSNVSSPDTSGDLSTGAKAGIGIGIASAVILGILAGWLLFGRKRQAQTPPEMDGGGYGYGGYGAYHGMGGGNTPVPVAEMSTQSYDRHNPLEPYYPEPIKQYEPAQLSSDPKHFELHAP